MNPALTTYRKGDHFAFPNFREKKKAIINSDVSRMNERGGKR